MYVIVRNTIFTIVVLLSIVVVKVNVARSQEVMNSLVEQSHIDTSFDPTPVLDGPAGKLTISSTFVNTSLTPIQHPFFKVIELSGSNILLNADGDPGQIASTLTPDVGGDLLSPGESFVVDFEIGLQTLGKFNLFVDLFGDLIGANNAPIANAGRDQTVRVNDTVTLDGSGSSDVDGDLLTYSWSLTSVPPGSVATLSDPTLVNPTFVADVSGTYVVQLIVNDGTVDSVPNTMMVTINNTISIREAFSNVGQLGAGLQLTYRLFLGASTHGGVTVRISSSNPNLAVIAPDGSTIGTEFIEVVVPDGETFHDFVVQGVSPTTTGDVDIIASAPAFADGILTVPLVKPVLALSGLPTDITEISADDLFLVRTGIVISTGNFFNQRVSMVAGDLTVTVSSSNSAVGQLVTTSTSGQSLPVVVAVGQFQTALSVATGGVAFDPLDVGSTTISATAPGFDTKFALSSLEITVAGISTISLREAFSLFGRLGAGLQLTYRVVLGASDHGGVTVRIASSDASLAVVAPDGSTVGTDSIDIDIPDGQTIGDFVVQSVNPTVTGSVDITASAPSFTDGSLTVPIVEPVLGLSGLESDTTALSADDPFAVRTGLPNASGTGILAQAVSLAAGDLTITVSSSNSAVGQLVTTSTSGQSLPVVVAVGQFQTALSVATGGVAFDPLDVGSTTISVSAPGFDMNSPLSSQEITVVGSSTISLREAFSLFGRLGAGLQLTYRVVLGASDHGGVTVRITSSNASLAVVAPDSSTVGTDFIDIDIPDGQTIGDFVVQSVNPTVTGSVDISASAPSFTDGSLTVPIVEPVLGLSGLESDTSALSADDPFAVRTGLPNASGTGIFTQAVSMAAGDLTVTVSSSNSAVGQLVNTLMSGASVTVIVSAGQVQSATTVANGGVAFDPLDVGITTISVSAPGFDMNSPLSSQEITVAGTSTISLREAFSLFGRLGAGLQLTYRVVLGASDHGGVTVQIASSNASLAVVAPDSSTVGTNFIDIDIPDGQTIGDFVVQSVNPTVTGSVDISASAPSFTDGSLTVPIVEPVLGLSGLESDTSALSADDPFAVRTGLPNASGTGIFTQAVSMAAGDLTVTVSSSNSAVGQLVNTLMSGASVTVMVSAGQVQSATTVANGGVAFDPLDVGITTISVSAPGFDMNSPLSSQEITVAGTSTISLREAFSLFGRLGAGLQLTYRVVLGASDHGGVTVRIASSNASLAVVAPDGSTAGTEFIDVMVPDGETVHDFVVQGVSSTATGDVDIIASAPAFTDAILTVPLVEPVLALSGLSTDITEISADDLFQVRTGIVISTGNFFNQRVSVVAGDLTVTVHSSNSAVGQLVTTSTSGQSLPVVVAVGQFQTAFSVATGGVAFDPLSMGSTTISASAPGFDVRFVLASQVVTVSQN